MINEDSRVYAIDPSNENLIFGKKLAELNNINNIEWIEAVCSDSNGDSLEYNGKIDHAKFYETKKLTNKFEYFFGEDQGRYIIEIKPENLENTEINTMSLNKPNTLHDTFREVEKVVYEIEKRFKK